MSVGYFTLNPDETQAEFLDALAEIQAMGVRPTGIEQVKAIAQALHQSRLLWTGLPRTGIAIGIVGFHTINP